VVLGVFVAEGEEEEPGLQCNGIPATLSPVDAAGRPLVSLKIIVGGGEPHVTPVAEALRAVGAVWQQWAGAQGAVPPTPVAVSIITCALAPPLGRG
jgi:hypothetical protein